MKFILLFASLFLFALTPSSYGEKMDAPQNEAPELIFVYNADSGLFASVSDFTHKIVSPDTYECNLCLITYGNIGMKNEWKDFLVTIPQSKTFLHKNEFRKEYPEFDYTKLPAIFINDGKMVKEFVSAEEINRQSTVSELKILLRRKLKLIDDTN